LQDKGFLADAARVPLRPVPYASPADRSTPAARAGGTPLVYLTFGTAFGTPELIRTALSGLSNIDADVVVATGRVRPDEVGDRPASVTVLDWVAQAELLPHVDLVVHHGGSGTTLGALSVGAPQLFLPQGADQFANAAAVTATGAGLSLRPDEVSPDAVADRARALLAGPGRTGHRDAARALAAEIASLPSPAEVARRLPEYAGQS
jgi:UDP:flavonoid glycosyltransferase YjiC (YdhE family)